VGALTDKYQNESETTLCQKIGAVPFGIDP